MRAKLPAAIAVAGLLAGCVSTVERPAAGFGMPSRADGVAVAEMNPAANVRCRIANGSGLVIEWRTGGGFPRYFVAGAAAGSEIYVSADGVEYAGPAAEGILITKRMARQMSLEQPIVLKFTSAEGRKQSRTTVLRGAIAAWRTCADEPIY